MKELMERIENEAIHRGASMIDVSSFLNHEVDPHFISRIGQEFIWRLVYAGVDDPTKIVTAEVSGICLAFATAKLLEDVQVLWMRKHKPITWGPYHLATAPSATHGGLVKLMVGQERLGPKDKVWIVDDFLWTGAVLLAMSRLIAMSGAKLLGVAAAIEKPGGQGREALASLDVPVISLCRVTFHGGRLQVQEGSSD